MAINVTGTYTSTYVLTNPTNQNPATIASTGLIDVIGSSPAADSMAISGSGGVFWNVTNLGTVRSTGSFQSFQYSAIGINLASGHVNNAGLIATEGTNG